MTQNSPKATPLRRYLALLTRYLKPQWSKASLMAVLLLSSIALQLVVPQILRFFIDIATQPDEVKLPFYIDAFSSAEASLFRILVTTAVLYLLVAFINQIFAAGASYMAADVGWTATNFMRRDLARHCVDLDMAFHTTKNSGEMIERIDGDVTALSDFFSQFSVQVFGASLLLIGVLTLLWLENPLVGIGLTVFTVIVLFVLIKTREIAVPATRLEREASAQLYGFIEERLAGIDDIRANGGGVHTMNRFIGVARRYYFDTRKAWIDRSVIWLTNIGLFIIGDVLTLAAAIYLVQRGSMTIGTGYLIVQYMLMLRTPIEQISRQMQELQKATASIGRIDDLFQLRSSIQAKRSLPLPEGALPVSFERVHFSYDDKAILQDVSFQLKANTVLGLLGRTGSGKTTLTRLLFRLYDPTAGKVRLGGIDIADTEAASLHQRVGMVTQEVQLFHASVRDNLTFFDASVRDEVILDVLAELGLDVWLQTLPEGLDTVLESGGVGLSAGEGQLLAFARVFLKNPGLIILDEPSSRLDPATEQRLERALDKLLANRTAIIIAHRLDTVKRADEIMILEEGQIIEFDQRERLVNTPSSHFYRLSQMGHVDLDALTEEVAA